MKHILLPHMVLAWLLIGFFNEPITAQSPNNRINILRYNDDFSNLKEKADKRGFDKIKYINLGKKAFLSVGGELRAQYQYFENQNFGDVPPTFEKVSVGQLWHRAMVHANLELSPKVRIFAQLNNTLRQFNNNPLTPEIDQNELSLHQAFVEWKPKQNWTLRLGRQEMGYGNNRIITFREGPNTRLTFNAAIIKYHKNHRKIDLLAISPVVSMPGVFDDASLRTFIYGIYGSEAFFKSKIMADYYYLYFNSKDRQYNFVGGQENRFVAGKRVYSQFPKLNFEAEFTYQLGNFNTQNINASSFSIDVNYKLQEQLKLVVGIAGNYITGDKDRNDNTLNTYNLIYSRPYYGLAAPIGSSNLENINPYFKVKPISKISVFGGVYFMQRNSTQDGTYSPGMAQVRPTPERLFASTKRSIGTQYALETTYQMDERNTFGLDLALFQPGAYTKETGAGKDIFYFSVRTQLRF
jgi:hypothetical protein